MNKTLLLLGIFTGSTLAGVQVTIGRDNRRLSAATGRCVLEVEKATSVWTATKGQCVGRFEDLYRGRLHLLTQHSEKIQLKASCGLQESRVVELDVGLLPWVVLQPINTPQITLYLQDFNARYTRKIWKSFFLVLSLLLLALEVGILIVRAFILFCSFCCVATSRSTGNA